MAPIRSIRAVTTPERPPRSGLGTIPLRGVAGSHGKSLRATDVDLVTGAGPDVSGPLLSLLLAMTGRPVAHAELSGEGLSQLASRMAQMDDPGRPAWGW